jgi:hypothetical protein
LESPATAGVTGKKVRADAVAIAIALVKPWCISMSPS